jgi:hypothetical protein
LVLAVACRLVVDVVAAVSLPSSRCGDVGAVDASLALAANGPSLNFITWRCEV